MAGRIAGITLEIGGDTTKLQTSLKGVDAQLRNMRGGLRDVDRLMKFNPTSTTLITQKQHLLKQSIEQTKGRLEQLKAAQAQMDAAKVDKNSDQYQRLQREIMATEGQLKNLEKEYAKVASVTGVQMQAVGQKMKDLGSKISEAGQAVTKNLTVPIVAMGAASIKAFSDVDKGMDTIVAKTGATGEALNAMKDSAKKLATEIPTDFGTAGAAVGEVNTRFDITGEALENLSGQFIKFAKMNGTDVSQSIDKTQKALAAYGKGADDASGYLDRLNQVGQKTGVSTDKLQDGIVQNATAFKEMGLSLDEATILMGQLEKSGVNSETVLNGMRKALKNAAKDGKPLNEALADMQSEIENGTGSVDGLTAAYDLFGKSGDQIYGAVKDGIINFKDLGISVEDAAGNIDKTFENTLDPIDKFKMAVNQAKVAGADLGNSLLTTLTPMIGKLQDGLKNLGEKFRSLSPQQQEMIVKIGLMVAAIGPAMVIIGKMVSGIGMLTTAVGKAVTGIASMAAAMPAIAAPIMAGVAAVGLLAGGFYALDKAGKAAADAEHGLTKAQRENINALNEQVDAYKQAQTAAEEKNKAVAAEFSNVRELKDEYNGLVDANGKIAEKDQARAEVILGDLARALGMEKSQIQELINKNGELGGSIDKVIAKKEAQAYLDENYDSYVQALQMETKGNQDLANAIQTVTQKEQAEAAAKANLEAKQKAYDNALTSGGRIHGSYQASIENAERAYDSARKATNEAKNAVEKYANASKDASNKVSNYQKLQEAVQTGSIKKINQAMVGYQNNLKTATTATKSELDKQAKATKADYEAMKKAYASGDVTKRAVQMSKQRADAAAAEAKKVGKAMGEVGRKTSDAMSTAGKGVDKIKGKFPVNVGNMVKGSVTYPNMAAKIQEIAKGAAKAFFPKITASLSTLRFAKAYDNPMLFNAPTLYQGAIVGDRGAHAGGEMIYGRDNLMRDIQSAVGGMGRAININVTVNGADSPRQIAGQIISELEVATRAM